MTRTLDCGRRADRHAVELRCELVRAGELRPRRYWIADLSPYGAWLRTSRLLPPGERALLRLLIPGTGRMSEVMVEVMWSGHKPGRGPGMALELVGLNEAERHWLTRALRDTPGEPASPHPSYRFRDWAA
jgi:hypothetical protein